MSQPVGLTDSRIVMAEQNSHDVVNQTLSGGDFSPSDVPAITADKKPAGGDVGETKDTATTIQAETGTSTQQAEPKTTATQSRDHQGEGEDAEQMPTDTSKYTPVPVAARALEMNGVTSGSDIGEDTASQGGSESDASRAESKLLARTGSKKPTSFKPVTFAKFSVPKAPGTPPISKPSEKAPSSTLTTPLGTPQQTSRPRLVVKSTSSLRDSLSKSGTSASKPGGSGPDPNQVWNKNRPVQQTPPKHLTDEELKQQYGIHMTSRIQEDGAGTESKWADIDDDEDDWAPETIEWTDGTKTNLTHPEPPTTAPIPSQEKAAADFKREFPSVEQAAPPKEPPKFVPSVLKTTTSVGPNPTVLRLGANAERQAKSAGIIAKGPNDKSPLLSTSPAPPPAKSPWAALPPVEKVSPVMPPMQVQPPMRAPAREPHAGDGLTGALPPKEIAADDFNRSWREMQSGTRELYNSRSGRYEPAPETRKGAWRAEQTFRTPSVLQRPAQGDQAGPAEPSAAFQTHRSSGQDGMHWTRRRTSSNVSGGSGSFGRRMSIGRPDVVHKPFESRRDSQVNVMPDPSMLNREPPKDIHLREVSPDRRGTGPWAARGPTHAQDRNTTASTDVSHATDEQTAMPPAPQEDPVAMQERIMKEKRMEARQRRLDQEKEEEAAKRERIRQKLEALGPPPEKPKSLRRESVDTGRPEANTQQVTAQVLHSPPKPPVPEPSGEPKQYGMMKVHHPDTVKKLVERERVVEKPIATAGVRRPSSAAPEPKQEVPLPNGIQQSSEAQAPTSDKLPEAKVDEQNPQWRSNINPPSAYLPWSPNPKFVNTAPPPIANPWKPLGSSDKTLGNGIFEQSLGGFPGRDISLRSHLGLDQPPIAPAQPFSAPARSPQETASISPLPSPEVRHVPYEVINLIGRPGPIGPPSSQHTQHRQHENRAAGTAAWNNFHAVASKREAEENEKLRSEMSAIPQGPASLQVTFNETWRQVRTGDQAGQRQVVGVARSNESNVPLANPLPGLEHPVGNLPFADTHARPLGSVPVRSSRFFPQATETPRKPTADEGDFYRSPSPPPPEEMSSHPVYTGDCNRPLVHLPAPKPIVKFPPRVVVPPPPPPTFASMVAAPPRTGPQHATTATSWQEKINTLFGKKTVTEKRNALAVTSATKEPLDVQLHIAGVSVSLPFNVELMIGDGEATAKQVEEAEEMFEDREAGSLPVVRVPTHAPPAAWQAALPPTQSKLRAKNLKSMQIHSVEPFSVGIYDRDASGHIRVTIRFPGAIVAKTVPLPRKSMAPHPRPRNSTAYKPRKNTKPRESSGGSVPKKPTSSQQTNGGSSPRRQSRNASWGPRTFSGSQ
ncbi:uncharacterized protein BO97DRAFT_424683 [Aspergillus homomorphus CBS 101889]|uniref:PI-PLC Y-box domain-containing protein n=1 Tax=Aspergillus homomorphus (strain CBS 101889) TaxID=1450537 RepID=A0A395HZ63_ASPHC|nr:hypothetical protein BO97DRAFT_424683 [Aspergillus homomorphus CBS 101889]RAL12158.1 hypothetical protein BO97DRAFT_424683 [Aspergillus homomorphus CBS 101889]